MGEGDENFFEKIAEAKKESEETRRQVAFRWRGIEVFVNPNNVRERVIGITPTGNPAPQILRDEDEIYGYVMRKGES